MQLFKEVEDKPMQNKNGFMDQYINSFMNKFSPVDTCIPYSGKLLREKTFTNFEVLWLLTKVFSANFGGVVSVGGTSEAIHDSFLRTNHIFHHFTRVFSLESFQYLQNILLKAATLLVQYCVTMAMAHDDL